MGIYRQARIRTTAAAAVLLLVPFVVFHFIFEFRVLKNLPELHSQLHLYATLSVVLGLVLSVTFGRFVSNHILKLANRLEKALWAIEERERERDSAQEELIKKLEAERELVRQRLQFESRLAEYEKYAALAQLALGAAHEINNPLLGILSHLELELKDARTPDERIEIEQCIEGAKRISATIRSLLNYARPGPLQLSRMNIERLVGETLAFLKNQPLFRNIRLETKIPYDLPAITADANQISQVLVNLLLNAAQAMPERGEINVSADRVMDGHKIEVRVSDTGQGIPPDILPHVFAPFFTTKRGKGTGLGLSISQSYIRGHAGEIHIQSTPGRGTTVRFTLPVQQDGVAMPKAEGMVG